MNLIKYRAQKNKNVIYRPCLVRIGRYLPSVMKMALGLRPRAIFMTSGKYLPIRTSRPVNNIYILLANACQGLLMQYLYYYIVYWYWTCNWLEPLGYYFNNVMKLPLSLSFSFQFIYLNLFTIFLPVTNV